MKLKKIKKSGAQYQIILDNGEVIKTFDEVILENNLLFDKNIDSELLNKINTDTLYYQSYNKVLTMISRRLRSEYEIREFLNKSEVIPEDQEKIIGTLKRIGLINDANFARAYTNDKINLSLDGPEKIRQSLEAHQIDACIIDENLAKIPEELILANLRKLIAKKVKANSKYTGFVLKQKITAYLINLGYNYQDINNVLSEFSFDNKQAWREMEKAYQKLSKKYHGDELFLHLKNKLYVKGFKSEEISDFINDKRDL